MVEFRAVSKVYGRAAGGRREALTDVSFTLGAGEAAVCAGPGGAGKSTLLRLVWGAERPSRGTVRVGGTDVGRVSGGGLARLRRRLGVVPDEGPLLADRTVFGNVVFVLRALGLSRRAARERALESVRAVGLAARANALPAELAHGERRRLLLARALAPGPGLLLVDEPAGGPGELWADDLVTLVRRVVAEGAAVLVATRSAELAGRLSARLLRLEAGRLAAEAPRA